MNVDESSSHKEMNQIKFCQTNSSQTEGLRARDGVPEGVAEDGAESRVIEPSGRKSSKKGA